MTTTEWNNRQEKEAAMFQAKDIMTENAISVRKGTPIYEAVELMVEHDISGMPVVKNDMTLLGILSKVLSPRELYKEDFTARPPAKPLPLKTLFDVSDSSEVETEGNL